MTQKIEGQASNRKSNNLWAFVILIGLITCEIINPTMTALSNYKQTKLKEQELNYEITSTWIDKATDERKCPQSRKQILRYLAPEFADQPLGRWAERYQLDLAKK